MLGKVRKLHFVGIGGVGMSGLALIMKNIGFEVTGSDLKHSDTTDGLERLGIKIGYEHRPENITDCDIVIFSSAIDSSNPEIVEAKRRNITLVPRGEMLAEVMRMKIGIAVSGTHGKTTTTSLVGRILECGGLEPTIVVGGRVKNGSNVSIGKGQYLVCEADESDKSFLWLSPSYAIITNIEEEHLDHYKDLEEIQQNFIYFANHVPFWGCVFLCSEHPNNLKIKNSIQRRVVTYGLSNHPDVKATDLRSTEWGSLFNVWSNGKRLGEVEIKIPGTHNILNGLAGISVGLELGIKFDKIKEGLKTFFGVHRRLELLGELNDIKVYDDYGHHPTEIVVTLETLRRYLPQRRIISVFQPHRYTRTYHLLEQFAKSFFFADLVIVTEIYAASEKPIPGINGEVLARRIAREHEQVVYLNDATAILNYLKDNIKPGDVMVTQGAGNIWQIGPELLKYLKAK